MYIVGSFVQGGIEIGFICKGPFSFFFLFFFFCSEYMDTLTQDLDSKCDVKWHIDPGLASFVNFSIFIMLLMKLDSQVTFQ